MPGLVGECLDRLDGCEVQSVEAYGLDGREGESAREGAKAPEQSLLVRLEQVVAPRDGRCERPICALLSSPAISYELARRMRVRHAHSYPTHPSYMGWQGDACRQLARRRVSDSVGRTDLRTYVGRSDRFTYGGRADLLT